MAEDKLTAPSAKQIAPLPRDEAPKKQTLRQPEIIRVNLMQALKLWNNMLTQDVLVQQHGAVVSSIISSCHDSVVSYWMKAMTQTLPRDEKPAQDQSDEALSLLYPLHSGMLEQQHINKSVSFLQLPCENISG